MVSDELGKQLHDRATRGEKLNPSESAELTAWYNEQDTTEYEILALVADATEAERFITLLLREPFDYTTWQRTLWPDKSIEDISRMAMQNRLADTSG